MSARILIVEDDDAIAAALEKQLGRAGFTCTRMANGDDALLIETGFDLAILDLMLPGTYGLDVLKRWRQGEASLREMPVILLTARDHTADKVRGLSLGADDYVTKPFYPEELLARVQARLRRRASTSTAEAIDVGPLQINAELREVRLHGEALDLTRAELEILLHLGKRLGHAVSRAELAELALDREDDLSGERALDVHMSRIRKKLGKESAMISTVWGIGYRLTRPSSKP